jgi:hypothetical protein
MTAVVTTVVGCALACFASLRFPLLLLSLLSLLLLPVRVLDAEEKHGVGPRTWTRFLAFRTSRRDGVADTS